MLAKSYKYPLDVDYKKDQGAYFLKKKRCTPLQYLNDNTDRVKLMLINSWFKEVVRDYMIINHKSNPIDRTSSMNELKELNYQLKENILSWKSKGFAPKIYKKHLIFHDHDYADFVV